MCPTVSMLIVSSNRALQVLLLNNLETLLAMVVVKVPPNSYVIEEEKFELKCIVKGTKPMITWEHRKFNLVTDSCNKIT